MLYNCYMSIYDLFETDVVIDQKRENELSKKNAREKLRYREKMVKDPLFKEKIAESLDEPSWS